MHSLVCFGLTLLSFSSWLDARPFNDPLLDVYDYIVVGGGVAGLTVANRLTENPNATVLVLEAGPYDNYEQIIMVPIYVGADVYTAWDWYFETLPQTYLDGATRRIPQGKILGGGSILNAMLWNRGGRGDYDDWASFGNPGWDWDGMLPYFQRSETFAPLDSVQLGDQYGIHHDPSVHGFDGPVDVSYQHYFYNSSENFFEGLNTLGIPTVFDPNDGAYAGATFLPLDINPQNQSRADARRSYYDPVASRSNLWVSTGRYVTQLVYDQYGCAVANPKATPIPGDHSTGQGTGGGVGGNPEEVAGPPPLRKRQTPTSSSTSVRVIGVQHAADAADARTTTMARREVILAAGSLQTPKVLELSGIGPSGILNSNQISTIVDLPGVGNNLQDHYLVGTYYQFFNQSYTYSNQLNLDPNNDTLNQLAGQEYYANRTGPWTAGPADGNAFPSLAQITNRSADIIAAAGNQASQTYLAAGVDSTVVAGYAAQLSRLISALKDPMRAVIELLNSNAGNLSPSVMRPFSRGSSHISSANPFDPPQIDPRYGSNPIDIDILLESLLFNRLLLATPSMAELDPLQWAPPLDADETALRVFINNAIGTEYHPSGTAAMLPLELGGVVDPNLLVYGTQNLRVVDASICPTIPAAHMQAVVYGIAEKASDIIRDANAFTDPLVPHLPSNSTCENATLLSINTVLPSFVNATSLSSSTASSASLSSSIALLPMTDLSLFPNAQLSTTTSQITSTSFATPASSSGTPASLATPSLAPATSSNSVRVQIASAPVVVDSTSPPAPGPFPGYSPLPATPAGSFASPGTTSTTLNAGSSSVNPSRVSSHGSLNGPQQSNDLTRGPLSNWLRPIIER